MWVGARDQWLPGEGSSKSDQTAMGIGKKKEKVNVCDREIPADDSVTNCNSSVDHFVSCSSRCLSQRAQ